MKQEINRRTFVKKGLSAAGVATAGVGLLANGSSLLAEDNSDRSGRLSRGATALLRFAAAAEILETDFWVQYNELCGIPDREVPGGTGNPAFTAALSVLDSDMAQYVHDNTDDEFTHQNFLNAYLASKGADTVSLEPFRTLPEARPPAPAENSASPISPASPSIPVGGRATEAARTTPIWIQTSPSRRQSRLWR